MSAVAEHERQQRVLRMLDDTGQVLVAELSEEFEVSPVTIRKDLNVLERKRLLRRIRGGAVPVPQVDEGSFEMRLRHRAAEKQAIARAAATFVRNGDAIALDCSTTSFYLAKELADRRGLVVVTNGLHAAGVMSGYDDCTVVLPGGTVRRSSWSLVGDFGDILASRGMLTRGFFGIRSLSTVHGLMELSPEETSVKRRLAAACGEIYAVFDSSKVGRFALNSFADADRITRLITDTGFDRDLAAEWATHGVPTTRVDVEEGR